MKFFSEKPQADSESPAENADSKKSKGTGFVAWLGKKLQNADQAISAAVSPEGSEIGKAMNRLLNLKKEDYRNAAFGLGCTSLAAVLLLNGGKMALSAAIPGMEHLAFSGINSDDLASIPGAIVESFGNILGMGHVDVASVTPHIDVPVTLDHPVTSAPLQNELSVTNDYTPNHPTYALEKPPVTDPFSQNNDPSRIQIKIEGQDVFPDKYKELTNMTHHRGGGLDQNPLDTDKTPSSETTPSDASNGQNPAEKPAETVSSNVAEQNANADVNKETPVATPEQKTANVLESQVKDSSTGESVVKNARTVGNQVGSGIASTSGPAVRVEGGVAHIGKG